MAWDIRGKTILVTGATSGIGLEAAVELARRGARVVMVGRDPRSEGPRLSQGVGLDGTVRQERMLMGRDDVLTLLANNRAEIEGFGVVSLRLFGSMARGEGTGNSDVDLLVRFRETPTFSGYMKLRIFLEDLLDAKVDLVTESGLREAVRPFVERDAIRVA